MKLSTRYGLAGMGALGVLSGGQWVRENARPAADIPVYLLGVLPNFAAAVAIPFVAVGCWEEFAPSSIPAAARNRFRAVAAFSCAGLVGWEFLQVLGPRLIFDVHDLLATAVGTGLAVVLQYSFARRA